MVPMLEVMIGVFFVFAVSSLTCSAAAELLEGFLKNRAKDLERGIISLVGSRRIGRDLLNHPLIRSLSKQEGQVPTHLPSRTFAIALLDLVARGVNVTEEKPVWAKRLKAMGKKLVGMFIAFPANPAQPEGPDNGEDVMNALTGSVDDLLKKIPNSALKRSLTGVFAIAKGLAQAEAAAQALPAFSQGAPGPVVVPGAAAPQLGAGGGVGAGAAGFNVMAAAAQNDLLEPTTTVTGPTFTAAQALGAIEKWFDDGMDQVTAWYKRRSQFIIFMLGLGLAAALNLDAIAITKGLAADPALRTALIAKAEAAAKAPPSEEGAEQRFKAARAELTDLGLPMGWRTKDDPRWEADPARQWPPPEGAAWGRKILGLLLTALATSLGASFWFDLLKKVMLVRAGLNPDEDSRQQRSKQKAAG